MTNIARNGGPKKPTPIKAHSGMKRVTKGKLTAGVSKTESAHPPDDSKQVHKPRVAKRGLDAVAVHDACDAAIFPNGCAEIREGEGKAILDEAEAAFLPRVK